MRTVIIIPARFNSTRFLGKPLIKIFGKELIKWVADIAIKTVGKKNVYVATENLKIVNFLKKEKINFILTSKNCLTGTDRVAEASKKIKANIYINLQGDEPLVNPSDIKKIILAKNKNKNKVICGYTNLLPQEDPNNINIPKVIINNKNNLIYASRLAIPGIKNLIKIKNTRYLKQVCIYAFNKKELNFFNISKKKTYLEKLEDIEILRFFDLDIGVKMIRTKSNSLAVDEPKDIRKIENFLKKNKKI